MSAADDILAYLDNNSTKVTAATNLFKNAVGESSGRAVFVIPVPGLPAIEKFSGTTPAMTRPRVQIVTRSTKAVGAQGIPGSTATMDLAEDMRDLLVGVANTSVNGITYQRIFALQSEPFNIGRDEAGRHMFAQNFQCLRSPTTQA